MKRVLGLSLAVLLLFGCKPSRPGGVLSESKMENVMVDYHLAQGMAEAAGADADVLRYKYIQAVFRKHHITEETFDSSLVYYSANAEKFVQIYQKVTKRVEAQATIMGVDAQATQDRYANLTALGDTANIWTDLKHHTLQINSLDNLYSFRMMADSSFHVGDRFLWRFNTFSKSEKLVYDAIAMFMVEYENDSIGCVNRQIRGGEQVELHYTPTDKLDSLGIKSVGGFVYLPQSKQEDKESFHILIMSNIGLIRFHHKPEPVAIDSLLTDSLETDTVGDAEPKAATHRLTPAEMRESQPREKKVNVVKEKPINIRQQQRRQNRRRWR